MTSILLLGAGGQLGQELRRKLPCVGTVISMDRNDLDLSQSDRLHQIIAQHRPDLIVNAAAYTAVDQAEREFELAHAINSAAPTALAEIAHSIGASLIHVSTDYVFNGQSHTPYLETDLTDPINAYGYSKLAGEVGIRQACDRHIILRTAWVYGTWGNNFVKTMLRLGADRQELSVVCDQIGAPTWAGDLAQAITAFASQCLVVSDNGLTSPAAFPWGTYHFTNSGVASWYDFAVAIFEIARQLGFPLQIERVLPISTQEFPTPAQRPAYSVLSLKKTSTVLGNFSPHWRQSLQKMLVELYTYESSHSLRR
ncbi:dTDP-4-dehydrorhamnose reductase [Phormidesmis priestleyi]